ncbi:hypothetical protein RJT34_09450 [Clitoria ternatea]|uniref:Uncharacterized protein n=1 Tax=Clitoria ternatea TaxID=43366 RepID=A0AAN9PTA7_CLITE
MCYSAMILKVWSGMALDHKNIYFALRFAVAATASAFASGTAGFCRAIVPLCFKGLKSPFSHEAEIDLSEVAMEEDIAIKDLSEEAEMPIEEAIDREMGSSKSNIGVSNKLVIDYSHTFKTEEVFPTREDMLEWVRAVGRQHGFAIVIS